MIGAMTETTLNPLVTRITADMAISRACDV